MSTKRKDVVLSPDTVDRLMRDFRSGGHADNSFDVNLKEGELAENELVQTISATSFEVKRDFYAYKSQNIAVEYASRGKASGIATTKASHWAFHLEHLDCTVIVKTETLKSLCRRYRKTSRDIPMGDRDKKTGKKTSRGIKLPILDIFEPLNFVTHCCSYPADNLMGVHEGWVRCPDCKEMAELVLTEQTIMGNELWETATG